MMMFLTVPSSQGCEAGTLTGPNVCVIEIAFVFFVLALQRP